MEFKEKLQVLQNTFFSIYPDGFNSPEFQHLEKKHKLTKTNKKIHEIFNSNIINNDIEFLDAITKILSSSSIISVFEKIKFRNFMKEIHTEQKNNMSQAIKELLMGVLRILCKWNFA